MWVNDIANEFKNRDNISNIGAVVGTVLSVEPLKLGILNNAVILDKSNSYICRTLKEKYKRKADIEIKPYNVGIEVTDSGGNTSNMLKVTEDKKDYDTVIIFKEILKEGDRVLVIATENNNTFFIVDKLEEI